MYVSVDISYYPFCKAVLCVTYGGVIFLGRVSFGRRLSEKKNKEGYNRIHQNRPIFALVELTQFHVQS